MPIVNQGKWNEFVEKNRPFPYGKMMADMARCVFAFLDEREEIDVGQLFADAEEEVEKWGVEVGKIDLFVLSRVAWIIWQCHSKGKEFTKKWNVWLMKEEHAHKLNDEGCIVVPYKVEIR